MIEVWKKNTPLPFQTDHIRHWVFDLDNTLYPQSCNLFPNIVKRMTLYIENTLKLPYDQAYALQKRLFQHHGTTLCGLMKEYDLSPHGFLNFVHDIDYSILPANPALRDLLKRLPGKKYIFTNATEAHSKKAIEKIGISDCFDGIFDIALSDWVPKPKDDVYDRMLAVFSITEPEKTIMFEDMACNLLPASKRRMRTALIYDHNHANPDSVPDAKNLPDVIADNLNDLLEAMLEA